MKQARLNLYKLYDGLFVIFSKTAKVVLNKMMDDLENNPEDLRNNKNFMHFFDMFNKYIKVLDGITERMHFLGIH